MFKRRTLTVRTENGQHLIYAGDCPTGDELVKSDDGLWHLVSVDGLRNGGAASFSRFEDAVSVLSRVACIEQSVDSERRDE